jgi:hypothetical protein
VYKCRRCGSAKRAHHCATADAHGSGTQADQRLRPWTASEDEVISAGVQELGFKWSHIAALLDGRTDNAVRNRWHRLEAARKWRAQVQANSLTQDCNEVPGYKCGRCGQPKRGHACPFGVEGPPAVATANSTPFTSSREISTDSMPMADGVLTDGAALAESGLVDTDILETEELAALFASLEACPAGEEDEEDDLCELVQDVLSPHELEQIISGSGDADETLEWQTFQNLDDGTTYHHALDAAASWVDGAEPLSVDGGVSF